MNIAVLGLGQAGGVISDQFYQHEVPSLVMNYSKRDLEALNHIPDQNRLQLNGSEGVGKDREAALRLMKDNWEMAITFVKKHFSHPSIEIIFVPFSTAGGSGSGIAPVMLDFLMNEMPEKTFVACPILPAASEVVANQLNCINTLNDLGEKEIGILPIDNQKAKEGLSKNKLYEIINESFVSDILTLVNYTQKSNNAGNLDEKDLTQLFNTNGFITIGKTNLFKHDNSLDLTKEGITQMIYNSWHNNIYADVETEKITRAGIIFEGQENLLSYIDHESVFEGFSNSPIDLFEGIYSNLKNSTLITILTGLAWPMSRIQKIEEIINAKEQSINQAFSNKSYKSHIDSATLNKRVRSGAKKSKSASDILKQYL